MYIGKPYQSTSVPSKTFDTFTGNGSTTTLTLSQTPSSVNNVFVYFDGVAQTPVTDYTLSGNTLTFSSAPSNGVVVFAVVGGGEHISTPMPGTIKSEDVVDGSITDSKIISLSANKFTGALPALDASAISSQFEQEMPFTTMTSDPTGEDNQEVGTVWINTTTAQMYVCTAKDGVENTWTNVGDGSGHLMGNVMPGEPTDNVPNMEESTTLNHTFTGGTDTDGTVTHYHVDQISNGVILSVAEAEVAAGQSHVFTAHAVDGDTDVTFRVRTKDNDGGYSNGITVTMTVTEYVPPPWQFAGRLDGYTWGSANTTDRTISKHTFASDTNEVDTGAVIQSTQWNSMMSSHSSSHAYSCGGYDGSWGVVSEVQKYAFSSSTDAQVIGNMPSAKYGGGSFMNETHGWHCFGNDNYQKSIFRQSHINDADCAHPGDMFEPGGSADGWTSSNTSEGFVAAGYWSGKIHKVSMASDNTSTHHCNIKDTSGNLTNVATGSTATHGYGAGAGTTASTYPQEITKFSFTSGAIQANVANIIGGTWYNGINAAVGTTSETDLHINGGYGNYTGRQKFNFASEADSAYVADIWCSRAHPGGTQI